MFVNPRLLGLGNGPPPPPPPPPPGPPPPWPMMFPMYQPSPTVYIERDYARQVEAPCQWYEDLQSAGDTVYCRAPAMWLVIAGVGAATLFMLTRKR